MSDMRSVEITAADIEEAIEEGLRQLQVAREKVLVEVLEEPTRGFLGIGSRLALVRLTTLARPQHLPRPDIALQDRITPPAAEYENLSERLDHEIRQAAEKRQTAEKRSPRPAPRETRRELPKLPPPTPLLLADSPREVQVGYQKLTELLRLLDIQAQIAVELTELSDEEDGETYILQIQGQNLNLLIGRRGETLSSLQYLTRMLAAKDLEKHPTFIVDVGRYKLRRTEKLYELAHRLANQAVAQGRVIKLEPMPAHERRIIHMALRQRRDVKTESVGEGRLRKVTLIPQ